MDSVHKECVIDGENFYEPNQFPWLFKSITPFQLSKIKTKKFCADLTNRQRDAKQVPLHYKWETRSVRHAGKFLNWFDLFWLEK